jgi:hypothetical protein
VPRLRPVFSSSALQPGQCHAIYHVRCSVTTRGYFYVPSRFKTIIREHSPASTSHPFQNPEIIGTWTAVRCQGLGYTTCSLPLFHLYMVALGLVLTSDTPGDFETLSISLCLFLSYHADF